MARDSYDGKIYEIARNLRLVIYISFIFQLWCGYCAIKIFYLKKTLLSGFAVAVPTPLLPNMLLKYLYFRAMKQVPFDLLLLQRDNGDSLSFRNPGQRLYSRMRGKGVNQHSAKIIGGGFSLMQALFFVSQKCV